MLTKTTDPVLFYESREGRAAKGLLRFHIDSLWKNRPSSLRTLALGAGGLLCEGPTSTAQLATAHGGIYSCLVDSHNKPLPDDDFDCVIALHACPDSVDVGAFLVEARRVLRGEGHLLLIVPRRRGFWTCAETPFAKERSYTAHQIAKVLRDRGFHLVHMKRALYVGPRWAAAHTWPSSTIERLGSAMRLPLGGGVFVIDAQKRQSALARCGSRTRAAVLMPVSLPQMT